MNNNIVKACKGRILENLKGLPLFLVISIALLLLAIVRYLLGFALEYPVPNFFNKNEAVNVSGSFPFSRQWNIAFKVQYESTNPACLSQPKLFGFIPQSSSLVPKKAHAIYRPAIGEGGDFYRINIPDNEFIGPCEWSPTSMTIRVESKNGHKVTIIEPDAATNFPPSRDLEYYCSHRFKKFDGSEYINKERFICIPKINKKENSGNEKTVTFNIED